MIKFLRGTWEGDATFELTGADADKLLLVLNLPLEREDPRAACFVTISPRDLTGDFCNENYQEGGEGDRQRELQGSLFELQRSDLTG